MSSPTPSPFISITGSATISPPAQTTINELDTFTSLFLLFIFFSLFIRICYVYMSMDHDQGHNANTSIHHGDGDDQNNSIGLPINIINSYHTFPYSKTNVATIYDHDTTCSICISDYKESEMLRMMPQCHHYFHRDCLDVWLKVNASCPICRNSPLQANNNDVTTLECV